jgi:hypothetical protein
VTDKTHTRVTFGFDNLDAQLQRLEKFLVYSDDSKQELATVNLLVQRNIPVTFATPPAQVINETIDPTETPRIMKAVPVHDPPKSGTLSALKPSSSPGATKRSSSTRAAKPHLSPSPAEVRRAVPNNQEKKK